MGLGIGEIVKVAQDSLAPVGNTLGDAWQIVLGDRFGDCQDFRVWPGIMGNKESHYVTTQRTCHTE